MVNDTELGPFLRTRAVLVSPDGTLWLTGLSDADESWFIETESDRIGPFKDLGPPVLAGYHFIILATDSDDQKTLILDGIAQDQSYKDFLLRDQTGFRSSEKTWFATAQRDDDKIDIFETGRVLATVGPFEKMSIPRVKGDHWSMLIKQDGNWQFLEDGEFSRILDLPGRTLKHFHSASANKLALLIQDEGKQFVVLASESFGPFTDRSIRVRFSDDGQHIQHMQKALELMNLKLTEVISDICGVTGFKIIDAILAGERDPAKLAAFRHGLCKNDEATIELALQGNWRDEHLFALKQAVELYRFYHQKMIEIDQQIEAYLHQFEDCSKGQTLKAKPKTKQRANRKTSLSSICVRS